MKIMWIYLIVLKIAYTSGFLSSLVLRRKTSSVLQKKTMPVIVCVCVCVCVHTWNTAASYCMCVFTKEYLNRLVCILPSWLKCVSMPWGPGTEQTSLALMKVLHLFTSTLWPPTSFWWKKNGLKPIKHSCRFIFKSPFFIVLAPYLLF